MAEDDFLATREGRQFRGSRYPGFVGGIVTPSTGLGQSTPSEAGGSSSSLPGGSSYGSAGGTSLASQSLDIPKVEPLGGIGVKDLGGMALGAGAQFAATEVGRGAGAAMAGGASLGEGLQAGAQGLGDKVAGWFGGSGSSAAASAAGDFAASGATQLSSAGYPMSVPTTGSAASSGGTSLASQSFGEGLSSYPNIGAGLGAGLASTVIGLATGQSPGEALKSGLGTGVGTYIGTAVGGPIGGIIGGAIGSIFCFASGTPILLADGTWKAVEDLDLGDETMLGGEVTAVGRAFADDLFSYKGILVAGGHAVLEDGCWLRVEESGLAQAAAELDHAEGGTLSYRRSRTTVYPVVTERHLLVTPVFIAADLDEVEDPYDQTEVGRIAALNADSERNSWLAEMELELCRGGTP
jgi:hypothetical protein